MQGSRSRLSSIARIGAVTCGCALLIVAGCRKKGVYVGKLVPVHGKVTLNDQPLTGGGLIFHPFSEKGPNSKQGKDKNAEVLLPKGVPLQDDGSFSLQAPVGKYRVQLDKGEKSDPRQWSQLPRKYTQVMSPLVVEVREDKPEGGYDLKLSSTGQSSRNKPR